MPVHHRKLKVINLTIGGISFECQISNWLLQNNTPDGEKVQTFCPDGEDIEEVEPDYALQLTFFSDWTEDGISDFFQQNNGSNAAFEIVHHPDTALETVQWTGNLRIKAPNVGGEIKTTETQTQTFQVIGEPVYGRV